MYEEYVKDMPVEEKTDEDKEIELILSIFKTKNELETANRNFEYADKELIDYYTYQIKANQAKLDYLVKKAKTKGLVLDMISGIELNSYSA